MGSVDPTTVPSVSHVTDEGACFARLPQERLGSAGEQRRPGLCGTALLWCTQTWGPGESRALGRTPVCPPVPKLLPFPSECSQIQGLLFLRCGGKIQEAQGRFCLAKSLHTMENGPLEPRSERCIT